MEQAKMGDTVRVHYTGKLDDGTVFDTSQDREPLEFTIGSNNIIPGFERAVIGMRPGESKTEHIESDDAYGPHREDMVLEVDRDRFPADMAPEVGLSLQIRRSDGFVAPAVVSEINGDRVKLDANHPLAGRDLVFEIELVDIRE